MTITMQGLLDADIAGLRRFADHYEELARLVDETVGDLGTLTRDLPNYWAAGPGSAAAQQHDQDLRRQLAAAYQPLYESARYLRGAADGFDHYRRQLRSVLAEAQGKGFRIDLATGRVTGPAQPIVPVIGLQGAQSAVDYYVSLLTEIMDNVDEIDRANGYGLTADLGTGGLALQGVAPDPGQLEIHQIGPSAEYNADWFGRQSPLIREQLATAYPEVIGAAPGLPGRYRDMANRILLGRRRSELAARLERADGAGSPALQRAQLDLAAADRLQKELAGPGRYLVDYRPGDEQHATLTKADTR